MAVLDDIRNGKGLKPIYAGYECATCKNKNCTGHGLPTTEKVCDGYKHTTTNADRIRQMSDEELAEWLAKYERNAVCPDFGAHDCQASCEQCWLDWLRTEVTE